MVRPHSEPSAQGQGGPGLPVLLGAQGARRLQRPGHHASRHSGHVAPAHEQALEAHRRAGHKPQARMVARRVRPRLPNGRRQGESQAGLLPVLLGEEEAREADKARPALGPSARKEWGRRRCLLPIGVILRILDWTAMRGSYGGPHRSRWLRGLWAPATCGRVRHLRDGVHAAHYDDFLAVNRRYDLPVLLRVEALFGGWHGHRDALCRRRRRRHGLHQRVGAITINFTPSFGQPA